VRYVLDASVAVAAAHPSERHHVPARARVVRVLGREDEIVVPALFPVEIAAALSRTGSPPEVVDAFVTPLIAAPTRLMTIGPRTARRIQRVATGLRLRAADAAYVYLAMREAVPLVTSDEEITGRAASACLVQPP